MSTASAKEAVADFFAALLITLPMTGPRAGLFLRRRFGRGASSLHFCCSSAHSFSAHSSSAHSSSANSSTPYAEVTTVSTLGCTSPFESSPEAPYHMESARCKSSSAQDLRSAGLINNSLPKSHSMNHRKECSSARRLFLTNSQASGRALAVFTLWFVQSCMADSELADEREKQERGAFPRCWCCSGKHRETYLNARTVTCWSRPEV